MLHTDISLKEQRIRSKKQLSTTSLFYFLFLLIGIVGAFSLRIFLDKFIPEVLDSYLSIWLVQYIPLYGMGGPILLCGYFLMKPGPVEHGEKRKMKPSVFFLCCFLGISVGYISSMATQILTLPISMLKGRQVVSDASMMVASGHWLINIFFVAIFAPVVEELIFRKLLYHMLGHFGELFYILASGIAFGLFHMNIMQILFATALGFFLAFLTYRSSGKVIYSILLHFMVNSISLLVTGLGSLHPIFLFGGGLFIILAMIIGFILILVLSISNRKKIHFLPGSGLAPTLGQIFSSYGVILYLMLTLGFTAYALIMY